MTRHLPRLPWAGPAVALALLFSTVDPPPAAATRAERSVTRTTATLAASPFCLTESYEFGKALADWFDALTNYENTVPGGTESEILEAAAELDDATLRVADTGVRLLGCLVRYLE